MSEAIIRSGIHPLGLFGSVSKSRGGRNEVIITPLSHSLQDLKHTIELGEEESIRDIFWVVDTTVLDHTQQQNGKKRNKRKHDSSSIDQSGSSQTQTGYLAILLNTGNVLVYNPMLKSITNTIGCNATMGVGSAKGEVFLYDSESSRVLLASVSSSKVLREYKVSKQQHVTYIQWVGESLLLGTTTAVFVLNPQDEGMVKLLSLKKNHPICAAVGAEGVIAVARVGDPTVELVCVQKRKSVGSAVVSDDVKQLRAFENNLVVITEDGSVSVFAGAFGGENVKEASVSFTSDAFVDAMYASQKLIAYYIKNDHFSAVELPYSESARGQFIMSVENGRAAESLSESQSSSESESDSEEEADDFQCEEVNDVVALLVENFKQESKIVAICSQNSLHARQTIQRLDQETCVRIFPVLCLRVADVPQNSATLNAWLQTIVILYGNVIRMDPDLVAMLKLLKSSLSESVKLLPSMLALQGRLILLESQLRLRNEVHHEDEEEEETADNHNGSTVVYNGENDDEFVDDGEAENDDDEEEDEED